MRNTVDRSELLWKAVAMAAGAAAGAAVRRGVAGLWRGTTKQDPPTNPASHNTRWSSAVGWVVASGVAVAVARLVAQRGAAAAWKAKTGSYPAASDAAS
jgi:Protein of unknown function (DUF4235)